MPQKQLVQRQASESIVRNIWTEFSLLRKEFPQSLLLQEDFFLYLLLPQLEQQDCVPLEILFHCMFFLGLVWPSEIDSL